MSYMNHESKGSEWRESEWNKPSYTLETTEKSINYNSQSVMGKEIE